MRILFMRRFTFFLLFMGFCSLGWAQHEIPTDTLHRVTNMPKVVHFGDYLLDMRLMNLMPENNMPKIGFSAYSMTKDFNSLFRLNSNTSYTQGFTNIFSYPFWGYGGLDYRYGFAPTSDYLNMGSFKLNNGMHLNMYGQYSANGQLRPDVNILPWEKHDFKGAFELKSANGAFGIRIEVNRQSTPYPY